MDHSGIEPAEQGAAIMTAAGMPRMPARVMMALVASPDDGYTAAELADRLGVSAAAISGAVRYLESMRIIHRLSRPGGRVVRYDIVDDGFHSMITGNVPVYERMADAMDRVADQNEGAPASAARTRDLADFFRFLARRMPGLVDEWSAQRAGD